MRTKNWNDITLENITKGTGILVQGKLAIVIDIRTNAPKHPIVYKNNTEHRGYICGLEDVQAILGDLDLDAFTNSVTAAPKKSHGTDEDWRMPSELKGIKIGDKIKMGSNVVVFTGYKSSRPKYPISYERNGKNWKGTMGSFRGAVV